MVTENSNKLSPNNLYARNTSGAIRALSLCTCEFIGSGVIKTATSYVQFWVRNCGRPTDTVVEISRNWADTSVVPIMVSAYQNQHIDDLTRAETRFCAPVSSEVFDNLFTLLQLTDDCAIHFDARCTAMLNAMGIR